VGLIEDWRKAVGIGFKAEGEAIYLIAGRSFGRDGGQLGQSLWLREIGGRHHGEPPHVDLELERRHGQFVRKLVEDGIATAVHDVSDGGLAVAVAEMALAGRLGCSVQTYRNQPQSAFAEDQGRYLVTVRRDDDRIAQIAEAASIDCKWIGSAGGELFKWLGEQDQIEANIPLADLRAAHESFFPALMDG